MEKTYIYSIYVDVNTKYSLMDTHSHIMQCVACGLVVALIFIIATSVRINQASIILPIVVSCCVAASERIVHLRTPKETTVAKIMDSCIKMLGVTEDKSLFILKEKKGAQHIM